MLEIIVKVLDKYMKMNALDKLAYLLVVIGGFNWGLVGWLDFNLVDAIFGAGSTLSRVVYAVVGMAALYMIFTMVKMMTASKKVV